ncbi:hypothetical protein [Acidithiobacillus ferrooxidans]|uniref:hypothetical protein n=1 Tax=Acidithiobacillus ferrooxidans TaxID=920 RepID=UPI0013D215E5|nr:hypothetical protein [Acidithiobacillus ferrooxidans]
MNEFGMRIPTSSATNDAYPGIVKGINTTAAIIIFIKNTTVLSFSLELAAITKTFMKIGTRMISTCTPILLIAALKLAELSITLPISINELVIINAKKIVNIKNIQNISLANGFLPFFLSLIYVSITIPGADENTKTYISIAKPTKNMYGASNNMSGNECGIYFMRKRYANKVDIPAREIILINIMIKGVNDRALLVSSLIIAHNDRGLIMSHVSKQEPQLMTYKCQRKRRLSVYVCPVYRSRAKRQYVPPGWLAVDVTINNAETNTSHRAVGRVRRQRAVTSCMVLGKNLMNPMEEIA